MLIPLNLSVLPATSLVSPVDIHARTNSLLPLPDIYKSSIDMSKAGKLKDVGFLGSSSGVQWVTRSLQTITSNHRHLKQIALDTPSVPHFNHLDAVLIRRTIGETTYGDWLELDRLLAKLCESHSIHLKVLHLPESVRGVGSCVETLLPEVTKRGMVGLAELR